MQKLLQIIKSVCQKKQGLKDTCRRNGIKVSFLVKFSFSKTKKIIRKLQTMYQKGIMKVNCNWLENELKLFHYSLLLLSNIDGIIIKEFDEQQWIMLKEFFPSKDKKILQYEAMSFIADKNNFKQKWSSDEDNILVKFLEQENIDKRNMSEEQLNWNQIAVHLFVMSEKKFYRTGKQCRERWLNHLDPYIKHGDWSTAEDKVLIENVLRVGKKWCIISKEFNGKRTEHMVKNRFLSIFMKTKKQKPYLYEERDIMKEIASELNVDTNNFPKQIISEDYGIQEPIIKQEDIQMHKVSQVKMNEVKKEEDYEMQTQKLLNSPIMVAQHQVRSVHQNQMYYYNYFENPLLYFHAPVFPRYYPQ